MRERLAMTAPRAVLLAHFAGYLLQFRGSLIQELVARGYETTVVVPGLTPELAAALSQLGAKSCNVSMVRTGLNPFADLAYRNELRKIIGSISPDVVIAYGMKPIVHGIPIAAEFHCKVRAILFAGLGALGRPIGFRQQLLSMLTRPMVRRAIKSATHVATQNSDDAASLSTRFRNVLPRKIITTEGSGVDLAHFTQAPLAKNATVLMVARIVVEKGIWEFIHAASIVRASHPDVRFQIAGFFESRAGSIPKRTFLDACNKAGVQFLGHVDDIRPLLNNCSLFVLPSYYGEGRPRSIQEALATGRPIVTTDSVGCRDAIIDGLHGRVVPAKSMTELAMAIENVLAWPNADDVSYKCRQYAQQRYCARQIAIGFLNAIDITPAMTTNP